MTNSKKDSELREWLADFATGQQGDTYYTTSPDDVSDWDIEELKQIIATNYITKEESDRRVLEARINEFDTTLMNTGYEYPNAKWIVEHRAELKELLNGNTDG